MRMTLTFAIVVGLTSLAPAQFEEPPPARFGIAAATNVYPQGSAKETLSSVIRALENNRLDYLAAHLLDPAFVDAQVTQRAPLVIEVAEKELRRLRDDQRRNPQAYAVRDRLSDEPKEFEKAIEDRAQLLAFQLLVRDMRDTLADNPEHLKDLRRFNRVQEIPADGETAELTLPTLPGRGVYFRLADKRWFLQDRRNPAVPAPVPATAPGNNN